MLSRLPIKGGTDEVLQIKIEGPLSSLDIENETLKDPVLSKVLDLTKRGWPSHVNEERFKPFSAKRQELLLSKNCICLGNRIIIPLKLQSEVLHLLHEGHPGIVRMKMLTRAYVYWPNINQNIENVIKNCIECQVLQNVPRSKDLLS